MSDTKRLTGLKPQSYEHPLDKKALDALQSTGGLETLVRKVNEWGLERMLRVQLTGSHLVVTEDSFPQLFALARQAAETIDLPRVPRLYVAGLPGINAFTSGTTEPLIVVSADALDLLTDAELLFLLGHEMGHIKSGHVLYYQIAEFLPIIGSLIGGVTLGLGELAGVGLQAALLHWKRMSEFTADRAGLLACQDPTPALTLMMKVAGLPRSRYDSVNTEDFIAQARAFEALDTDALSWIARRLVSAGDTHPWTVLRAQQALLWLDSGEFEKLVSTDHRGPLPLAGAAFCQRCGTALPAGALFCVGCGQRVQPAA